MKAYKAFNDDWTCRDFQFEIGKTYKMEGEISLCSRGFHACLVPFDCWNYYPGATNLAEVEGEFIEPRGGEDSKVVAASITISASLSISEWVKAQVARVVELCKKPAQGYKAHSVSQGDRAHSVSQGDRAHSVSQGYSAHSVSQGDRAHSEARGVNSIAASFGIASTAKAQHGWLVLAEYDDDWNLVLVRAGKVGDDVKAGVTYRLVNGQFAEALSND